MLWLIAEHVAQFCHKCNYWQHLLQKDQSHLKKINADFYIYLECMAYKQLKGLVLWESMD